MQELLKTYLAKVFYSISVQYEKEKRIEMNRLSIPKTFSYSEFNSLESFFDTESLISMFLIKNVLKLADQVDPEITGTLDCLSTVNHERRPQQEEGRRGGNQTSGETNYRWEGHHKHGEEEESGPTPGTQGSGNLHWENKSP